MSRPHTTISIANKFAEGFDELKGRKASVTKLKTETPTEKTTPMRPSEMDHLTTLMTGIQQPLAQMVQNTQHSKQERASRPRRNCYECNSDHYKKYCLQNSPPPVPQH